MENLTNISVIKELFAKYGFSFSKSLGQNFLVNPSVCPRIADLGNSKKGFGVIEIGTGVGVLTNELAKTADKVVAIEIDERLMPLLEETMAEHDNFKVINADILNIDVKKLIEEEFEGLDVAVCANLPYYITSPIIMKLLEEKLPIKSITAMVQKEAGQRLCANLGTRECGAITVAVRYYSEPKILFNVSRGSFMPAPNVDSCVIKLDIKERENAPNFDEKFFFSVVRGAFEQRRKTLSNSLSSTMKIQKEIIYEVLTECNISHSIRPEQLLMEQFIEISNKLKEKL